MSSLQINTKKKTPALFCASYLNTSLSTSCKVCDVIVSSTYSPAYEAAQHLVPLGTALLSKQKTEHGKHSSITLFKYSLSLYMKNMILKGEWTQFTEWKVI